MARVKPAHKEKIRFSWRPLRFCASSLFFSQEDEMAKTKINVGRRNFLKQSAALGVGAVVGRSIYRDVFAASNDRITIYHTSVADSINPYNQSSSSIYGNWQHVIEPLVEFDYAKKGWVGVLAESWEFRENRWGFNLKKGINLKNGGTRTSKTGRFPV